MTPKEKAKELVDKFQELNRSKISDYSRIEYPTAKQCAFILVDENLKYMYKISYLNNLDRNWINEQENYFNEVIQEIRNL